MNEEELIALKALIKPGRCPSQVNLRKIEDYIIALNKATWRTSRKKLEVITQEVLEQLGIKDHVMVSFRNVPGFLLNPSKVVKVWTDKEKVSFDVYHTDDMTESFIREYLVKDGDEYYTVDCKVTWYEPITPQEAQQIAQSSGLLYRAHILRGRYKEVSGLKWKAPEVVDCQECNNRFTKAGVTYNERVEGYVDSVCNEKINSFVNQQSNPATPITGYHSHKLSWKFYPQRLNGERTIPMGVELEMHNKYANTPEGSNRAATSILMTLFDDNPQYYFETDSSLSTGGFEMITNPMALGFATAWWSRALPIIRKHCVGYGVEKLVGVNEVHDPLNYGIHITVPRSYLPDSVIVKIARFFDARDNYEFMGAIAQRQAIYGGYNLGIHDKPKASTSLSWNKEAKGSLANKDRRQPINIKPKLVEFRMFRSTLNQVSFLKNLEFIDAITSYYKEALGTSYFHRDFLVWLKKNSKRYPNLITYLKHPVFFVKGHGPVKNNWLSLIKDLDFKVYDPYKEYGPKKPLYFDSVDQRETSMVGA